MRYFVRRRSFMRLTIGLAGTLVPTVACSTQLARGVEEATRASLHPTAEQASGQATTVTTSRASTKSNSSAPTATADASKKPNYFSTDGTTIVDAEGNRVYITGINWFGMETGTFAPHGLWARSWHDMLDQVANLGYNTIRLPFSNTILDPNCRPLEGIDFNLNPDLRGLNGLEIMDTIAAGAGERGLKIILDRHRPAPEAQSKLWYTDEVSEEQWIADWEALARRYLGNDTVIAADLHNEPAGEATWGTDDPKKDWRLAAERAGNAILAVNPHWLIVVEGIEKHGDDWYWMGGSLQGAATAPVRLSQPNKLVYSAHDYGPGVYHQRWFDEKNFPDNLPAIWDKHWGYLVKNNIAPVLMGEFGGRSVSTNDTEGVWQRTLITYLKEHGIHYTYWCLNPNSGDTGGLLTDDWKTVDEAKQALLADYLAPKSPIYFASTVNTPTPVTARTKPLPEEPVTVTFRTERSDERTTELTPQFTIVNHSASRLPLEQVELRYWFTADDHTALPTVSLDWASVGDVQARVIAATQEDQTHQLVVTFGQNSGMVPANGKVEIKLRVKGDGSTLFDQSNDYSFRIATGDGAENERVGLYFWGQRIWGTEPKATS